MGQSPSWQANSFSASQEISSLLWNSKVHYRVKMNPPLDRILSQMNPVHNLIPYSLKIHFNIVFLPTSGSPKWSFPVRFPDNNFVCISHHPPWVPHVPPSQRSWFDHRNGVRLTVWITKLPVAWFSPSSCWFLFHRPKHSYQLRVLTSWWETKFHAHVT